MGIRNEGNKNKNKKKRRKKGKKKKKKESILFSKCSQIEIECIRFFFFFEEYYYDPVFFSVFYLFIFIYYSGLINRISVVPLLVRVVIQRALLFKLACK